MRDPQDADDILVDAVKAGRESAFEILMRRHTPAIRNLIARYFRDHSRVDDLAQETFVKAYFSLADYRGEAPLVFWLKRIAVRLCLDELTRSKKESSHFVSMGGSAEETIMESSGIAGLRNSDAEEQMHLRLWVDKILGSLPPVDRMILILTEGEGYQDKEVARLTGLSLANVKVRAFRLRRRLRKQWQGLG